jgi:hypothetical protein
VATLYAPSSALGATGLLAEDEDEEEAEEEAAAEEEVGLISDLTSPKAPGG